MLNVLSPFVLKSFMPNKISISETQSNLLAKKKYEQLYQIPCPKKQRLFVAYASEHWVP